MITVSHLSKEFVSGDRRVQALKDVSLAVPDAQIHGIVGQSGAGKSTLVRCLTLLDTPSSGTLSIDGQDLTALSGTDLQAARRRIGLVFQHANLFDARTAVRNVAYPLEISGLSREKRLARATELLELVGLKGAEGAYPSQLSGGQKQRVGIARALAADPKVLLCDEPTSALDPSSTAEVLQLIRDVRDRLGLTVLVITHEMSVVKTLCDSVSLLQNGTIVESGSVEEVVASNGALTQQLVPLPPLSATPLRSGETALDILAVGDAVDLPFVAEASRLAGSDVPVMAGSIERIAGGRVSRLRVAIPAGVDADHIQSELRRMGATVTAPVSPEVAA
ncbi:methionine ABC transporter ATP-binding protein [Galactobacter caseinivorans]|uniref:Methionine ABC transporter ATP-binding protein n=1 Tax=Galactobacter caseinivorans TaxID=2676123 RepID=A0A496PME2_9MICC|nr:methionine ABC transporter ATP-binding protein [Galactobacter caseinivorans]RKW71616.1 methionine ABC transporter ATP-binding protein [Galactobacter caseinivorans]